MLQNNILGAKNFNFFGFFNVGLKCFEGKAWLLPLVCFLVSFPSLPEVNP